MEGYTDNGNASKRSEMLLLPGTALTVGQISSSSVIKNATVLFDGDAAGIRAS